MQYVDPSADSDDISTILQTSDADEPQRRLVIDSIWDCLDAILGEGAGMGPALRAVTGGEDLQTADSHHHVIFVPAEEVERISSALSSLQFADALQASRTRVEELYGGALDDDDYETFHELYLLLRNLYSEAASGGCMVVKW
jgi:hypothetical protein